MPRQWNSHPLKDARAHTNLCSHQIVLSPRR